MSAHSELSQKSQKILIDKLKMAYLTLDHEMCISAWSDNIQEYGFNKLNKGDKADDRIDFLVGLDVNTQLDLPVVCSPNGLPVTVSLVPDNNELNVLIWNVTAEHNQQQQLQQKANEIQLLLEQKNQLLEQLGQAKENLERKNKELSEASRLQTAFLSGVSHEFRTPLSSIIGYNNLLNVDKDQEKYTAAISRSSRHLLSLVENLLDHGKFESNELVIFPKKVCLRDIVEDTKVLLIPLAQTKYIDFEVRCHADPDLYIYVDEVRLRQCLINLVGNAIKFTDEGSVSVDLYWQNDTLSATVTDTGLGIAKQDIDKIFLSFWQAQGTGKTGTGLGLTITKRIVELMGGELKVGSELNKGTTISFSMTAPKIDGDDEVTESNQMPYQAQKINLLLAEDDQDIADLLILLLEEQGVKVTWVANGALAVDTVRQNDYDLLLMDIHMPVMGGYRAVELIRQFNQDIPIIITTASAVEADRLKAESIGCSGYLVKPVNVEDILVIARQSIKK